MMALALKQLHPDWKIRAHIGWDEDDDYRIDHITEDDDYRIDHVYVVAPDGSAYDCRGQFPNEDALVGEDVTGGVDTHYADFNLVDIRLSVQRGELKRFTQKDIKKASQLAFRGIIYMPTMVEGNTNLERRLS